MLFQGSHLNWAALTKEAYVVYTTVKKLPFYVADATIIIWSDHLPMKEFFLEDHIKY